MFQFKVDNKKEKLEDFKTAICSTVRSLSNSHKVEVFFGNQASKSEKDSIKLPNLDTLRCFHVNGDTGVTYNKNVWHHPLLVKKKQDFWVIDRINDQEDTSINLKEYHFTNNETRFITL